MSEDRVIRFANVENDKSSEQKQSIENQAQTYTEILAKNAEYKKTFDNTGYLFIGDAFRNVSATRNIEDVANDIFSRYKQKKILNHKMNIFQYLFLI